MNAHTEAKLRKLAVLHVKLDALLRDAADTKIERDDLACTIPMNAPLTVVLEDGTAVLIDRHAAGSSQPVEYTISKAVQ